MTNVSFKNIRRPGFVGRSFKSGYRIQRHWDRPMATAFFCGETGAGLFIISMLMGFLPGIIGGLLITGVGKTFFHLTHMGVPGKAWRAILRPDRSWVSRGLWGIVFFIGFGTLYAAGKLLGILPVALEMPLYLLALLGAAVVLVYQGFAMSHSAAISLWNTGLMPLSSMLYGLLAGAGLVGMLAASGFPLAADVQDMLPEAQMILLAAVLLSLFSLLHGAKYGSKGAQQSYELLTRDFLAVAFWGGVVGVGLVVPLLVLLFLPINLITATIVGVASLAGFYGYRILMFRAGVLDPVLNPANGSVR